MPRRCTTCDHPERAAIDAALLRGETNQSVSERFGLSLGTIGRHRANHLRDARERVQATVVAETRALADAAAQEEGARLTETAEGVRAVAARLVQDTLAILAAAQAEGDARTALAAIREARGCLETLAGMLAPRNGRGVAVWAFEDRFERVPEQTIEALLADPDRAKRLSDLVIDAELASITSGHDAPGTR